MLAVAAVVIVALLAPIPALAGELPNPRDVVRAGVDRLVGLLDAAKAARSGDRAAHPPADARNVMTETAGSLFDLDEMTRRTLSHHWSAQDTGERSEAAVLVGRLLEQSILRRISALALHASDYRQVVDGEYATVLARAPGRPADEGVEYRLYRKDGRWRVYDVVTHGFSFVAHYRTQLDRLIRSASLRGLVETLRRSVDTGAVDAPSTSSDRDLAALLLPAFLEQASRRR